MVLWLDQYAYHTTTLELRVQNRFLFALALLLKLAIVIYGIVFTILSRKGWAQAYIIVSDTIRDPNSPNPDSACRAPTLTLITQNRRIPSR